MLKNSPASQSPAGRDRLLDLAAIACLALIGALALWPYLFEHRALYWGDIELYFAPMQQFFRSSVSHGIVPLWNPYIFCGEPYAGDPQTWMLYPPMLLARWFSPWSFLTVDAALHLILGGAFLYLLARDQGCSRLSSLFAALPFMLGGYFVEKVQFPNMAQAIAYVPGVVWLAGRFARAPSARSAMPLGLLVGLQLLAAHAQVTLITLYLAAAYSLFLAWPSLRQKRGFWLRLAGWGFGALVFAACLDAGQFLPVLELWRNSDRQVLSLTVANRFFLSPGQEIGFIWPDAFGSPYHGDFSMRGTYWECACYLGVLPCLLALAGAAHGFARRSGRAIFWLLVLLISIWLAEGRRAGLYEVAFYALPGVRAFHDPARLLLGAAVAGPILAGMGLDALRGWRPARHWQASLVGVVILVTAVDLARFDRSAYPLMPVGRIEAVVRANAPDSASLALPGHRVVYPPNNRVTWKYFADYGNFQRGDLSYFPELLATHTTDSSMLNGLADAGGYEPEPPRGAVGRYIAAYNAHFRGDDSGLDVLCVDSLIAFAPVRNANQTGYFASHRRDVWRNPRRSAITRAKGAAGQYLPVRDISPDAVDVLLPPHGAPEAVTLADTNMPGWRARIGGQSVPVLRTADGLRQAIAPPSASLETLEFRYRSIAWLLGVYITLLAWAFTVGYLAYAVLSARTSSK